MDDEYFWIAAAAWKEIHAGAQLQPGGEDADRGRGTWFGVRAVT